MAWIEDQTSHSIPLNLSLIQSKALMLFNYIKDKQSEEAAEEKSETIRSWVMRLKEGNHLDSTKSKVNQQALIQKLQQVTQKI